MRTLGVWCGVVGGEWVVGLEVKVKVDSKMRIGQVCGVVEMTLGRGQNTIEERYSSDGEW